MATILLGILCFLLAALGLALGPLLGRRAPTRSCGAAACAHCQHCPSKELPE